ncbi:hypothetical protein JVT61DRAFT_14769 [Boletus reticuloceps]|uniref:Uncharacterized protein n=1 Tax=Boletus reticuloceps TaxID=495285 RepID=A0A8I3AC23_9AGAM|nr:hypothetical protein JVT61DRAFT_14769 [Boletus reticuloceps]
MSRRKPRSDYTVLSQTDPTAVTPRPRKRRRCRAVHVMTLRRVLFCLACIPVIVLLAILCQGIPPSYDDIRLFERRLPQHAVAALTPANDRPTRYLKFPGHLWGHGLNNVLQEALLMSYLAYVSNVSYVFEDYTWSHIPLSWSLYGLSLRPTRIPLNAIISGPTAGGPMPDAPLAVSAEFYQRVCSGPDTTPYILSSANAPNDADGADIIDWWQSRLAHIDAQCIEIDSSAHVLFDRFLFGGPRILSLFDPLVASPILADFYWSPLVHSAIARNFPLFQPRSAKSLISSDVSGTLTGLVAVISDGATMSVTAPTSLNGARSIWVSTSTHPSSTNLTLRSPRFEHNTQHSRGCTVLSNEWAWALGEVRDALERDGWADVRGTIDLQLDAAQYHVSMAVDMAIAERAEVFVGNGFSSLSSNVVMLRFAKAWIRRAIGSCRHTNAVTLTL